MNMDQNITRQIRQQEIEELGEALLDFRGEEDLINWFENSFKNL